LQREVAKEVEPSITAAEKASRIKWQNSIETTAELAHAKWTLTKPQRCKWKPMRKERDTTHNASENQWEEKETPRKTVNGMEEMKWMKPMKARETTSSTKMTKRMRKLDRELESNNEGGKV